LFNFQDTVQRFVRCNLFIISHRSSFCQVNFLWKVFGFLRSLVALSVTACLVYHIFSVLSSELFVKTFEVPTSVSSWVCLISYFVIY
jgi:hypothetical protein